MAQAQNWGRDTDQDYIRTMRDIVEEICLNSVERNLNIWDVEIVMRERGNIWKIGSNRRG